MPLSNRKPRFSMYGLICGMLLTVAPSIAVVTLTRYELTNAQLSDLNKGEVVVVKCLRLGMPEFVFHSQEDAVLVKPKPIFIECEHFKDFMPRTLKSMVSNKKNGVTICRL